MARKKKPGKTWFKKMVGKKQNEKDMDRLKQTCMKTHACCAQLTRHCQAQYMRYLHAFEYGQVTDGKHVRAMCAEHQVHVYSPFPDALHRNKTLTACI